MYTHSLIIFCCSSQSLEASMLFGPSVDICWMAVLSGVLQHCRLLLLRLDLSGSKLQTISTPHAKRLLKLNVLSRRSNPWSPTPASVNVAQRMAYFHCLPISANVAGSACLTDSLQIEEGIHVSSCLTKRWTTVSEMIQSNWSK